MNIDELLNATQNVDKFGELSVLVKLSEKHKVEWFGGRDKFDILVDNIVRVEVKSCNRDNKWAKSKNWVGGFGRIDPTKFNILVCTSFDKYRKNQRFFIFYHDETLEFDEAKEHGLKNLNLAEENPIIQSSEDKWEKVM